MAKALLMRNPRSITIRVLLGVECSSARREDDVVLLHHSARASRRAAAGRRKAGRRAGRGERSHCRLREAPTSPALVLRRPGLRPRAPGWNVGEPPHQHSLVTRLGGRPDDFGKIIAERRATSANPLIQQDRRSQGCGETSFAGRASIPLPKNEAKENLRAFVSSCRPKAGVFLAQQRIPSHINFRSVFPPNF